ncbi:MAG: ABC transporter ATP-binding protein [Acidimicrobiia bacterium]|nr:ABC transporter ATP-binding protein [Acidimicrobiia bacterium]
MLVVHDVTVRFPEGAALADIGLEVPGGETLAVLGPSGSGKTTLLRVVAGLQRPDAGAVRWEGADITTTPAHRRGFGIVFQDFALFPHLDVGGNVAFGLRMAGAGASERADRVRDALRRVDLAGFEDRPVSSLSGGQAQRVALARALIVEPRMLLLDEPFGSLDRELRQRLALDLRDLLDRLGITALHVTHDQEEAFAVADRVAVLVGGRILRSDRPHRLWRDPADETVARFLGLDTIVDGLVRDGVAETPLGRIPVPGTPEGPTRLVVRPEAIVPRPDGPLTATVRAARFRGVDTVVDLDIDGLTVEAVMTEAPDRGDRITVAIDPDGVSVLG